MAHQTIDGSSVVDALSDVDFLGGLLDHLPVGVFRVSASGTLVAANRTFAEMFGLREAGDLLGRPVAELYADPADLIAVTAALRAESCVTGVELVGRRVDGRPFWLRSSIRVLHDDAGEPDGYTGVIETLAATIDELPETLEASDDLQQRFEQSSLPMVMSSLTLEPQQVNRAFTDTVGYSLEELAGLGPSGIHISGSDPGIRDRVHSLLAGDIDHYEVERVVRHKEGRHLTALMRVSSIRSQNGDVAAILSVFLGVTDRRAARLARSASEAMLRGAFVGSPIGMVVTRSDGTVERVNPAFCRMMGMTEAELKAAPISAIIHPSDFPSTQARMRAALAGEVRNYSAERRLRHKDGHYFWGLFTVSALYDDDRTFSGWLTQVVDITERRRAEDALRHSEARFRSAFDDAPVGMMVRTPDMVPVSVNQALCRMLGYTEEELLSAPPQAIVGDEAWLDAERKVTALLRGESTYQVERRMRRKDGSDIWVFASVSAVRDASGEVTALLVQMVDITDRHQAQEELLRRESENRALLDTIPDLMFRLDRHGVIRGFRVGAELAPAMPPGEFLDKSIDEVHPAIADAIHAQIASVLSTAKAEILEYDLEVEGERRHFESRMSRLRSDEVLTLIRDITDRKRAAEQLEALVRSKDEFVAAVSHELRTPLTTVVGLATELRDRAADFSPEQVAEFIGLIAGQGREMAELVDDLLAAAQGEVGLLEVEPMFVDLEREVREVLLAWPESSADVIVESPAVVLADPFRVRQIVRNLVTNAFRFGGKTVKVVIRSDGEIGSVLICDDGDGVPEEEWELIFDPYYRSDDDQTQVASLGLGLTIGRMLAWLMDGELSYAYDDGWSTFELNLPIP